MEANAGIRRSSSQRNSRSQDSALPTYVIQEDNKTANPLTILSSDASYNTRTTQNKSDDSLQELTPSPTNPQVRWLQQKLQRASAAYPRLSRIVLWLRGPKSKVELPCA